MARKRMLPLLGEIGLLLLLSTIRLSAANFYVTPTGAGTHSGADWSNAKAGIGDVSAWNPVPVGGDTIVIAGGAYGSLSVGASGVSGAIGNPITIRRARASLDSGIAGWSAGYESQAVFTGSGQTVCYFYGADNWVVDGQVDAGILIQNTATANYPGSTKNSCILSGGNNQTFRYLDLQAIRTNTADTASLQLYNSSGAVKTNIVVSHCRLHGGTQGIFATWTDYVTVDHSEFYDVTSSDPSLHQNAFYTDSCSHLTVSNSSLHDYTVEGIVIGGFSATDYFTFYGNLFYPTVGGLARGIEADPNYSNQTIGTHVLIYNNSFICDYIPIRFQSSRFTNATVQASMILNNLFSGAGMSLGTSGSTSTHDYNWFSAADSYSATEANGIVGAGVDPFANSAVHDYHIGVTISSTYPRNKGTTLAATYQVDPDGVTRGADGAWDIGAYEYAASTPSAGQLRLFTDSYTTTKSGPAVNVLIIRTNGSFGLVTCQYATIDGSAVAGHDYTSTYGTASFGNGSTNAVLVTIPIVNSGDTAITNRSFTLALSSPTGGAILAPPTVAAVTITMNPPGIPLLSYPTFNSGDMLLQPTISQVGSGITNTTQFAGLAQCRVPIPTNWQYWVSASVNAPSDSQNSWWINFDADPRSNDQQCWDIVTFTSGFEARQVGWRGAGAFNAPQFVTNYWTLSAGEHTLWIGGREPGALGTITISPVYIPPPTPPTPPIAAISMDSLGITATTTAQTVTGMVYRTVSTNQTSTVNYSTVDGTALAGRNYTATSGTLTFSPGVTNLPVLVSILNDPVDRGNLPFFIQLSNPDASSVLVAPTNETVMLYFTNAPAPPPPVAYLYFAASVIQSTTLGSVISVPVARAVSTNTTSTVHFSTQDGTALSARNYNATSGTLTFAPGDTLLNIPITILADPVYRGVLAFYVNLTSPDAASQLVAPTTLLVTLTPSVYGPPTKVYSGTTYKGSLR